MLLALVCWTLAAGAAGARSAASLVPARMDAALLLDGSEAAAGLRAFLDVVAQRAPALAAGPRLAALVGPDLLAQPVSWGLAFSGPRALVLSGGSVALSAPVRDAKAARTALQSWLDEASRPTRRAPLRGPAASEGGRRMRAGMVAPVSGSLRLLTASGPQAAALVAALSQIGGRKPGTPSLGSDRTIRAALARLTGPAGLVVLGSDPVRAAALSLEGSREGLVARGLMVSSSPLLARDPPGATACADASLLCVRAAVGAGGRALLAMGARAYLALLLPPGQLEDPGRLAQAAALAAERAVLRSDGADARLLAGDREAPWALRLQGITEPPPPGTMAADVQGPRSLCIRADAAAAWIATPCATSAPADARAASSADGLDAQLDLAALDAVLAKVTPIDALRGSVPAAVYAARLLVGNLLRTSGPLRLTGRPHDAGAEVELRWPLR